MNYEINLLHHVGVVAQRVCAAAAAAETAAETAAHEGDDNTPSGPTGRGLKIKSNSTNNPQKAHPHPIRDVCVRDMKTIQQNNSEISTGNGTRPNGQTCC